MSLLRKLFGGSEPWVPNGPIQTWPASANFTFRGSAITFDRHPSHYVDVVGESQHQSALERVAGGRTTDGARYPDHIAMLLPEPTNRFDTNAVRVLLVRGGDAVLVGYLNREDAVSYRSVIDRVAATGSLVMCHARLKGGWDRNISFGVMLLVGAPWSLMAELDRDVGADPRFPSPFKAFGDDGRPYNRTDCPYCRVELDPLPKAKKACRSCGGAVYVRSAPDDIRYLLRDVDLKDHDARWANRR